MSFAGIFEVFGESKAPLQCNLSVADAVSFSVASEDIWELVQLGKHPRSTRWGQYWWLQREAVSSHLTQCRMIPSNRPASIAIFKCKRRIPFGTSQHYTERQSLT